MSINREPTSDPTQRLPWIALGAGALVILIGVILFFWASAQRSTTTINVGGTPTVPVIVVTATSAPVTPTAVPSPSPTTQPSPTPEPSATPAPTPASAPTQSAASPVAAPTQAPPPAGATQPPAVPKPAPTATAAPFQGQVSNSGGLGNSRNDLEAAYGAPAGETPGDLLVFRKDGAEYHADMIGDPARAQLIVRLAPTDNPWTEDAAMNEARKLFPKDVQPRSAQPEGNQQWVVERFSSPSLAQALPASVWRERSGQPGDFLAVYVKNSQGRITRLMVGAGTDPALLVRRSGE